MRAETKKRGKRARTNGSKKTPHAKRKAKAICKPSSGQLALVGVTVPVPLAWFIVPLRLALAAPIKPPTARTRRRQCSVSMRIPMAAFCHIMAPFDSEQIVGLEWLDAAKSTLKPTRVTEAFEEFRYVVDKPGQVNKLFQLGEWDREIPGTKWKRGSGAQRLHLSQAAGQRGQTSTLITSVTGKVTVQLRVYPESMPNLLMFYHVSTMDERNHVTWGREYDDQTKAGLRKLIHSGLNKMVADTLYPTGGAATALTATASDSVFVSLLPPASRTLARLTMQEQD